METRELDSPLNQTQLEILRMFNTELSEEELVALKRLFVQFLAEKAKRLANQVWEEKGWTNEDMKRLAHTHMRTPYRKNT